jgi:hypothetical protein
MRCAFNAVNGLPAWLKLLDSLPIKYLEFTRELAGSSSTVNSDKSTLRRN